MHRRAEVPTPVPAGSGGRFSRPLLALILGQICLHASMAGLRMTAPLQALRQGHPEWVLGLLLALFALAPIALAMAAGRLADRHGYHRPVRIAVGLSVMGAAVAVASSHIVAACVAALLTGAGANMGLIAIQRSAGHMASGSTERIRIFSWLGLAPALSNVVGPVAAGLLIDWQGFRAAHAFLMLLPLAALYFGRHVPREASPQQREQADASAPKAWDLLRLPGLRRLLLLNWLISASWDVHTFVLPILGHERGLSASAIGTILGVFALAVAGVRLLIPLLAHRLSEGQVLAGAMLGAAAMLVTYPFVHTALAMGACAVVLGLALGSVQPMVMSWLHQVTPAARHGEAIALRSVTINLSSTLMPLLFGVVGATVGASSLLWAMAAAMLAGSLRARRL